jgi:hypothetical protein
VVCFEPFADGLAIFCTRIIDNIFVEGGKDCAQLARETRFNGVSVSIECTDPCGYVLAESLSLCDNQFLEFMLLNII